MVEKKESFEILNRIGYVVGVFDLFHYGHQNLILESIKRCDKIIMGVHTDKFVESYKRRPIDNENIRKENILNFLKSQNLDIDYEICIIDDNHIKLINEYNINVIFHGTDWKLESYKKQIKYYEYKMDLRNIKIELIDYTKGISTTDIINKNVKNLSNKKCFLFDLDNTIMLNNKPMKLAGQLIETLNKNKKAIYLITNNNRYSPKEIFEELKENNLHFLYENIISPLIYVKQYLIENNYKNIYCWGSNSAKTYLESNGIKCNSKSNMSYDIVVVLYNNNFNYTDLSKLCTLIKNKNYIVGNIDNCYPDKNLILPDTGSIVKLIEYSCNKSPLKIFGKPNSKMLSLIKEKYINDEIIFIGDSEITDKKLALNCEIDFLRVHKDGDISDLGVLLYYINNN
jgi:glycerol-3-phosphate cytidylyltransferase